jgi:hypothetical protein
MNAEQFIKWLRDVLAHGDGRKIWPLRDLQRGSNRAHLTGFKIVASAEWESDERLTLSLYHDDMVRIGGALAHIFCKELSSVATTNILNRRSAQQRSPKRVEHRIAAASYALPLGAMRT